MYRNITIKNKMEQQVTNIQVDIQQNQHIQNNEQKLIS